MQNDSAVIPAYGARLDVNRRTVSAPIESGNHAAERADRGRHNGRLCCYLAKILNVGPTGPVRIQLVESSEIGILGVGEGTFPSIRGALSQIGISEARFVRATQATFKPGMRFVDWVRPAGSTGRHHYFHPFDCPVRGSKG